MAATPLRAALRELDEAISAHNPELFAKLRDGASPGELGALSSVFGELPADVGEWFAWHDGQAGDDNIAPGGNNYLLSSAAAREEWEFLIDDGNPPIERSFLPLLANGAGDYVLFEAGSGRLLQYVNDEAELPEVAPSLADFAIRLAEDWRAVDVVPDEPGGWSLVPGGAISPAECEPGTGLYFRSTVASFGPGVCCTLFWKQERNKWFTATQSTVEACWATISANLFPFRAFTDARVNGLLTPAKIFADGHDAPHVGLYRGQFPHPPAAGPASAG